MHQRVCGFLLMLASIAAVALERQDGMAVRATAEAFLRQEAVGLPGEVALQLGKVDERLALPACGQLQAFLPPGARPWGNTTVGVRCVGGNPWTIYVPAQVKVTGSYLVAARPLAQGQALSPHDVVPRSGELTQLPAGVLVQPEQLQGKVMASGLAAGEPLRTDMLRARNVLQSNQPVRVVVRGSGFTVSAEGRALTGAAEGQSVQVRVSSGQVVAGIARPGPLVEVLN